MRTAIVALLSSKKFLTAIIAMIVWALGRWGIDLDVAEVTAFVSPLMTAIIGQGVADLGKESALINANAAKGESKAA